MRQRAGGEQTDVAQHRHHGLADAVELLQVRVLEDEHRLRRPLQLSGDFMMF